MTERTQEKIKAFWFPILMSILGAVISFIGYLLVQNMHEMSKNIASIDVKLGVLSEKYSTIDKTIDNIQMIQTKNTMDMQQYMVRLMTLEAEIDFIKRKNND